MSTVRLKVTAPLESRDGTLAKDARMKNMIAEKKGDVIKAIKRPGIGNASAPVSGPAQGMIYMNGVIYGVVNDVLFGVASGGGGSQQPQTDWVKVGDSTPPGVSGGKNRLFMLGSVLTYIYNDGYGTNGIYTTANGINWSLTPTSDGTIGLVTALPIVFQIGNTLFAHEAWLSDIDYLSARAVSSDGLNWTVLSDATHSTDTYPNRGIATINFLTGVYQYGLYGSLPIYQFTANGRDFSYGYTNIPLSSYAQVTELAERMVVFSNKIFAVGIGPSKNQVWSTSNGTSWTQEVADWGLGNIGNFSVVLFNDEILAMTPNKIYSSSNGISWAEKTYKSKYGNIGGSNPPLTFILGGDLFAMFESAQEIWKLPASAGGPSVMTRPL